MNKRSLAICVTLVFQSVSAFAEATSLPSGFADAVSSCGEQYRHAVAAILKGTNAATQLESILKHEPVGSENARQARILLAHVNHPDVFPEFDNEIQRWREEEASGSPRGGRPGFLSGLLMRSFVKRGPESRYVDERNGWQRTSLGNRPAFKKVEKYTDAEVAAGIARNAAARQAVLEHFLKFLDEGDAYEQSEMVGLVNWLWRGTGERCTNDLAVVDLVQDVDALIHAVFRDRSCQAVVRMSAFSCLPEVNPTEAQAFMLNVVTNTPPEDRYFQIEAMVGKALYYLESSADANALAVLKSQTNGPAWKREKIKRTVQTIEGRLSTSPGNK